MQGEHIPVPATAATAQSINVVIMLTLTLWQGLVKKIFLRPPFGTMSGEDIQFRPMILSSDCVIGIPAYSSSSMVHPP